MSIISEVSKLIDAGFTKEDISKLYNLKENDSTVTPAKEDPSDDNNNKNDMFNFDSLTSQLNEITKLIRSSNLIKDEQSKPRTIDDIFESMFDDNREE